jgi:CheY-like chemotaxis protein
LIERKFNVLVVEDHADSAATCCRLLESFGHSAASVASVDDLVIRAQTETFDLLVCDIRLEGISGLAIPKLFPLIPALAVTGYGSAIEVEAYKNAGFREHVLKPFTTGVLLAAIDRCGPPRPCDDASPWAITD